MRLTVRSIEGGGGGGVQGTVAHHYYSHVDFRDWWDGYDVVSPTPGSAQPSMAVQTSVARTGVDWRGLEEPWTGMD